jgi:signal transduction histidine kinase
MSRLPIRARLAMVFALATVVVLAAAALFIYVRLRNDLDDNIDEDLQRSAVAAAELVGQRGSTAGRVDRVSPVDPEDGLVQVIARGGRVIASSQWHPRPVLRPAELRRAGTRSLVVERRIGGVDGTVRLLARPATRATGAPVVVAGRSLGDRDELVGGLVASFAVGGPIAVLLASVIGYGLARTALRPVEAMRRRAAVVSLSGDPERLPLPAARDEVRRLGETLNDMLERLRRSFAREREFVADASHELRTPIAVLKTELEGALRAADHAPEVRAALVAGIEECDHLAQLAEDLLTLARAADGALPLRPERLDVQEALERVGQSFADRAERSARRIEVHAPPGLELSADATRLRQALGNLVDNALRHGDGEIVIAARSAAGVVELDVSDGGDGFPPGLRGSEFERFARGDDARGRDGAGLGLAIVRSIAEAHGGHAATVPGPRTTVRIWMPAGEVPPAR